MHFALIKNPCAFSRQADATSVRKKLVSGYSKWKWRGNEQYCTYGSVYRQCQRHWANVTNSGEDTAETMFRGQVGESAKKVSVDKNLPSTKWMPARGLWWACASDKRTLTRENNSTAAQLWENKHTPTTRRRDSRSFHNSFPRCTHLIWFT